MKKSKFTTRQMALDAVLAAICMVLGYYGPDLGNLKITFEGLPVILAGLLLGPLDGAVVGGIGTLLYQLLRYGVSATTLLWILPYVLCGLIVGWIGDRCAPEKSFWRLALTVLAGEGLIFLLNTPAAETIRCPPHGAQRRASPLLRRGSLGRHISLPVGGIGEDI